MKQRGVPVGTPLCYLQIQPEEEYRDGDPSSSEPTTTTSDALFAAKHKKAGDRHQKERDGIKICHPGPEFLGVVDMEKVHLKQHLSRSVLLLIDRASGKVCSDVVVDHKDLQVFLIGPVAAL